MKIHYTNVHKEDGLTVEKEYNTKCPHVSSMYIMITM